MLNELLGGRLNLMQTQDLSQLISIVIIMRSGDLREAASRINDIFHEKQKLNGFAIKSVNPETQQTLVRILYYLLNACKLLQAKRVLQRADTYLAQGNLLRAEEYYLRVESLTDEGSTFLQAVHNRALCIAMRKKRSGEYFDSIEGFYRGFSDVFPLFASSQNNTNNVNQHCSENGSFSNLEIAAVASGLHYVACILAGRVEYLLYRNQSEIHGLHQTLRIEATNEQARQILKFCRNKLQTIASTKMQKKLLLPSETAAGPRRLILSMCRLQEVSDLMFLLSESRLVEAEILIERIARAGCLTTMSPNVSPLSELPLFPKASAFHCVDHQQVLVLIQQSQSALQRLRSHFLQAATHTAQSSFVSSKNNCMSKKPSVLTSSLPKSKYLDETQMSIVSSSATNDLISSTHHTCVSGNTKENTEGRDDGKKENVEINSSKNFKIKMSSVDDEMFSQSKSDSSSALQAPVPVTKPLRPSLNTNTLCLSNDSLHAKYIVLSDDSRIIEPHMLTYSSCKPPAPSLSMVNASLSSATHREIMWRGCITDMNETMNDPTKLNESEEAFYSVSDRCSSFRNVSRQSLDVSPILSLSTSQNSPATKLKPTSISVAHLPTDIMSSASNTLRHSCPPLFLSLTPKLGGKSQQLGSQNARVGECVAPCQSHNPCIYLNVRRRSFVNTDQSYVGGNGADNFIVAEDFSDNFIKENQESLIMSQAGDKGKLLWSDVLRQRASLKHVEMDNAARLLQNYTENSIPAENSIPNNHRYDAPHQLFDNPHSYHVPLSMLLAPGPYPPHVPPHCREASTLETSRAKKTRKTFLNGNRRFCCSS